MKFNNDLKITIEYNTFIQLTSKLSDISFIVDTYYEYLTNEYITTRVEWFNKL